MDAKGKAHFKRVLLAEKERLINNSKLAVKTELNVSPDDLPDENDLAAHEVNQNLVFKLRDRERQLISKINAALFRLEDGSFGLCLECEEPIEPRRLEVRPMSTHCISCKERQEHREKVYA